MKNLGWNKENVHAFTKYSYPLCLKYSYTLYFDEKLEYTFENNFHAAVIDKTFSSLNIDNLPDFERKKASSQSSNNIFPLNIMTILIEWFHTFHDILHVGLIL